MAAADIGASFSNNANPALGGGGFGFERLDVSPIADLARYTMLYNKSQYDQRQKDADEKILELAKIANFNLNDLRGKDKDEVLKEYNDLMDFSTKWAREPGKTPQEKIEQNLQWQLKYKAVFDKFVNGKARAIKYIKELDGIDKIADSAATKEAYKKQLENKFNQTPIGELFGSVEIFKTTSIDTPAPVVAEVNILDVGGDENINTKGSIYIPSKNAQAANATLFGLNKLYKEDLTGMTESQVDEANVQGTIESEAKVWADVADNFNTILSNPVYYTKDASGNQVFDEAKFRADNKDNIVIMRPFEALVALDKYSKKAKADAVGNVFEDKGLRYKLPSTVTPEDFDAGIVDFNKGKVSATQLIQAGSYAKYAGDKFAKTVQPTGDALDQQRLALTKRGQDLDNGRWWAQFNKGSEEDVLSADAVLREVSDVINSGVPKNIVTGSDNKLVRKVTEIADPNLLREFGTIDKDGATTNTPDVLHFDDKTNKMSLIYYKKERNDATDATDKTMKITTDGGLPVIDRRVEMQPTQWLSQITKRKNPNKDIGSINTLIDQVYNKYGRNLKNMVEAYKGGATITTDKKTNESGGAGGSNKETPEQRAIRIANEK